MASEGEEKVRTEPGIITEMWPLKLDPSDPGSRIPDPGPGPGCALPSEWNIYLK